MVLLPGSNLELVFLLSSISISMGSSLNSSSRMSNRDKAFSLFQVIEFPNIECLSSSEYNGTCYTSSECASQGGISSGVCASGYGVCCVFSPGCGSRTSQNNTYLVQPSSTNFPLNCVYTICKCSSDICRIRFDFQTFEITKPFSLPAVTGDATKNTGSALGDCTVDRFSIFSIGNQATPVICGYNTGQHMIIDATPDCHDALFNMGQGLSTSRKWTIKVTQYACGDQVISGAPDCLQYFTGLKGTIASYNFPTSSSTVPLDAQHLSNQKYNICIRREVGYCAICYMVTPKPNSDQEAFGLSESPNAAMALGDIAQRCRKDYLDIAGGQTRATVTPVATSVVSGYTDRFCGRFFNSQKDGTVNEEICTRIAPYRISFVTNDDEFSNGIGSDKNELSRLPAGTIGFSLNYEQIKC